MGIAAGVQPRPAVVREVAADGALTLTRDDGIVSVESTNTTAKAATLTGTQPGHIVHIICRARSSSGSYTVTPTEGTVTLNSTGEGCVIGYDGGNWRLAGLTGGATFTPV